jgi:hypothetical protein
MILAAIFIWRQSLDGIERLGLMWGVGLGFGIDSDRHNNP